MFSGIIETTGQVVHAQADAELLRISVERPSIFTDLKSGDSICCDGICLTLEEYDHKEMRFALGPETLAVTGWSEASVLNRVLNLERSLRLEDRIHGHLVTGHVDTAGKTLECQDQAQTRTIKIEFAKSFMPFIWAKGSVAINGVSLTVNQVASNTFSIGLIPETLKRTNLGVLRAGDRVNLEFDNMARGLVNWAGLSEGSK